MTLKIMSSIIFYLFLLNAQTTGWFKAFGSPYDDYAKYGLQLNNCYYLMGTHARNSTKEDFWLVKADSVGDTLWTIGYSIGLNDNMGLHMQRSLDNCFFMAGAAYTDSNQWDAIYIKVDTMGNPLQLFGYGGTDVEWAEAVCTAYDGGCALTGVTFSYGSGGGYSDLFVIRLNSNGDTMWTKNYGTSNHDQGFGIKQTPDSGFVIAGWNGPDNNHTRPLLMKTNANGDVQWCHYWGNTSQDSKLIDVCLTPDNGYLAVGFTALYGAGSYDGWLLKVNAAGDTVWTKTFGGTGIDFLYSICPTPDHNYVMAGGTISYGNGGYDLWLLKIDPNGNLLWQRAHGYQQYEWGESVEPTSDGGYVISGRTNSIGSGNYDFLFVKTDSLGNLPSFITEQNNSKFGPLHLNILPNPFLHHTRINFCLTQETKDCKIRIYDVGGRLVRDLSSLFDQSEKWVIWDGKDMNGKVVPAGIYWVDLFLAGKSFTEKIIKLK